MTGRAVVALQPDDLTTGKILLEAQDVANLGAAPAVDRLIIVADAGQIAVSLREQPQPEILGDIGVLILVDQDDLEAALIFRQQIRLLGEKSEAVEQKVTEIAGIERAQAILIVLVEGARPPLREIVDLAVGHALG